MGRWIARHQAGLFFPMLLLEGLDLHLSSGHALCRRRAARTRAWWVESVLLAGHLGGYLAAVFWVLPVAQAVAFVAVHQGLLAPRPPVGPGVLRNGEAVGPGAVDYMWRYRACRTANSPKATKPSATAVSRNRPDGWARIACIAPSRPWAFCCWKLSVA